LRHEPSQLSGRIGENNGHRYNSKVRAKANKRSLQAELHELLTNVVKENEQMRRFHAKARRIAAMTPDVPQTDSALLIREDRDR